MHLSKSSFFYNICVPCNISIKIDNKNIYIDVFISKQYQNERYNI